jgi:outer membrane lipoprotein-sorting protein
MQRTVSTRRGFTSLLLAIAAITAARPARAVLPAAQRQLVERIEAYFNGIRTLEAGFEQVAPDGSLSTGKLYIDRDRGGMRFDYDPPSQILLVAPGDWRVIFYDGSIKQVNVIPLVETPLGFILNQQVRLDGDVSVASVQERADDIDVTLVRTAQPDQGRVVLTLAKRPLELRRWSVTDAQGLTTSIVLSDLRTGMPLDSDLFIWKDPKMFGWPED